MRDQDDARKARARLWCVMVCKYGLDTKIYAVASTDNTAATNMRKLRNCTCVSIHHSVQPSGVYAYIKANTRYSVRAHEGANACERGSIKRTEPAVGTRGLLRAWHLHSRRHVRIRFRPRPATCWHGHHWWLSNGVSKYNYIFQSCNTKTGTAMPNDFKIIVAVNP